MIDPDDLYKAERELYAAGHGRIEAYLQAPAIFRSSLTDADLCRQSGQHHRRVCQTDNCHLYGACANCGHD